MLDAFDAFVAAASSGEPFPVFDWSDAELSDDRKPTRYLAVADFTPSRHNPRLSGHRGVSGHLFAVTIVAETTAEVRAARDRLCNRIEGVRLTAGTGETLTTPLYQDESTNPLDPVEDTSNPRLFSTVDLWRCASTRVPVS